MQPEKNNPTQDFSSTRLQEMPPICTKLTPSSHSLQAYGGACSRVWAEGAGPDWRCSGPQNDNPACSYQYRAMLRLLVDLRPVRLFAKLGRGMVARLGVLLMLLSFCHLDHQLCVPYPHISLDLSFFPFMLTFDFLSLSVFNFPLHC